MNDEKVFGPFTLKQFIYFIIAVIAIYFIYNNFDNGMKIPIIILIAALTIVYLKRIEPPPFNEEYIKKKKAELSPEKFRRMIQRKIAMLQFQISLRKERGLVEDPSLSKAMEILSKEL